MAKRKNAKHTRGARLKSMRTRLRLKNASLRRLGNERMRAFGVRKKRYLGAAALLVALILVVAWLKTPAVAGSSYRPTERGFATPMSGLAVDALDRESAGIECVTLVYAAATWRELEPEYGEYAFDAFEEKYHLKEWWAEGRKLILRVALDVSGEMGHRDIPDWLYELTGGEGAEYGGGFSPDYSHPLLMERHKALVAALGARYDANPNVAYVEIGSLGQNGAWSAREEKMLPVLTVARSYVWHYQIAFPNTMLVMPRAYREARALGAGLYNDALADADATWAFLDALRDGGYDDGLDADLYPMASFWTKSPSGGALTGDLEALLTDGADTLGRLFEESHLCYVKAEGVSSLSEGARETLEDLSKRLGARIWIRAARWDASTKPGYRFVTHITVRNEGTCPIYGAWTPVLALLNARGEAVARQTMEASALSLLPGETELTEPFTLPADIAPGTYTLAFALRSAEDDAAYPLAMADAEDWAALGTLEIV